MRASLIAAVAFLDALVFVAIVYFAVGFAHDLQRPQLAARTMHLLARAMETTTREIASVGSHFQHRDG
jgi:hypothetical protein